MTQGMKIYLIACTIVSLFASALIIEHFRTHYPACGKSQVHGIPAIPTSRR